MRAQCSLEATFSVSDEMSCCSVEMRSDKSSTLIRCENLDATEFNNQIASVRADGHPRLSHMQKRRGFVLGESAQNNGEEVGGTVAAENTEIQDEDRLQRLRLLHKKC